MLAVHILEKKVEHYHTHKYLDMQKIKGITAEIKEKNQENCDFFRIADIFVPFYEIFYWPFLIFNKLVRVMYVASKTLVWLCTKVL